MAFLSTNKLNALLTASDVITPFKSDRLQNGSYELSLGEQVFLTSDSPREVRRIADTGEVWIEPGQFALLLTEEYIKVPEQTIAFISIKAKMKWKGLVNVSGFHVDPGFEGKLLFSVYNAGPYRISLRRGEKYFPIWFAYLKDGDSQTYEGSHKGQVNIAIDAIEALSQGEMASPSSLSKRIDDNQSASDKKIDDNYKDISGKISLLEKEGTAKDYLIKTAVGLAIVLLVKFGLDWLSYNNGLQKGIELKQKEMRVDSIIYQRLEQERKLLIEIDSLKKLQQSLSHKDSTVAG